MHVRNVTFAQHFPELSSIEAVVQDMRQAPAPTPQGAGGRPLPTETRCVHQRERLRTLPRASGDRASPAG